MDWEWEIVTTRPLADGAAALLRSRDGASWGVEVEWLDGTKEWTKHTTKDIAVDEFWKL